MYRLGFALLLAALAALAAARFSPPAAGAQDEKKAKTAAPAADGDKGDGKDDSSRVLPVFDPGAHTQPVAALGFTADKRKLVTVGQDFTVQVWSAATGERLDVLRLPGYGREKGFDPGRWDVAAVSADGTLVAVGGQAKFVGDADEPARLIVVHLPTRTVKRVGIKGNTGAVTALAFSPSGGSLAVGLGAAGKGESGVLVLGNLPTRVGRDKAEMTAAVANVARTSGPAPLQALAFTPDATRLIGGFGEKLAVWDVPAGLAPKPKLVKEVEAGGSTNAIDWSPDGKTFARAADGPKAGVRAVEVWAADGTRGKAWTADDLAALFPARGGRVFGVKFLDAATLYVAANRPTEKRDGGVAVAGTVDVKTGKDRLLAAVADVQRAEPLGCASADGKLVALTAAGNVEARVSALPAADDKWVRCGGAALPAHVGWAKDAGKPGFAWTDQWRAAKDGLSADVLDSGFDLAKVEPLATVKPADYEPTLRTLGEWALEFAGARGEDEKGGTQLKRGGKAVRTFPIVGGIGQTLVPDSDKPPRVAFATHTAGKGAHASIHAADGTAVAARLLPLHTRIHSMAASPDGRFLICTTGTPRIVVYRTDGSPYPLFSFARVNREWVIWTPEGYYAASPGGEKLFGWAVGGGPNELAAFHPAEKFAKHFRRPDVIKLTVEKGSVKDALAALKAPPAPAVETILPPAAKLELVGPPGATVKLKATAVPGAPGKPVLAMRVLLDGRPLVDDATAWTPKGDRAAEGECEVAIPPGAHELRVLARSADAAAVSDPVAVFGPPVPGQQPTLYRVCVGVSEYADPGLKLGAAANDAGAMFEALERHCVGPDNRFGAAKGKLVRDREATRAEVLKTLDGVQKAARPGDLVVVFFAGHGVSRHDPATRADVYYLLTHESDVSKPLTDKALSGDDLQNGLKGMPCPVLLILDACHSAGAVPRLREFRPAVDQVTRAVTHENVGVTVLTAAMSYETAGETAEHGHFTRGLLDGLKAGAGVPYDPHERRMYVHHLYAHAYGEVRHATRGKQNPCLNTPWTVPPLPIRDVPMR